VKVTVIGTGYVGLVSGACLARLGHQVACVDISPERVECIEAGRAPFHEPGLEELIRQGLDNGRLLATTDLQAAMRGSEVSIISVGTPQDQAGRIDLRFIETAAADIGRCLAHVGGYHVVTVKSTVVPGTTANLVRARVEEASGMRAGEFGLCMNPEFLREGSAVADFAASDRIVIGQWAERSGDVLARLYESFACPVLRTTLSNAEMIKYASNSLLATLISYSNEIAGICETIPDTDASVVMDGLNLDRRLLPLVHGEPVRPGIQSYLRAGIGYGGSCLPKDVNALRNHAKALGADTALLDAVAGINRLRPGRIIDMVADGLGDLKGKRLAVFGLAFKEGTDDLRDSPAMAVIAEALARGASVAVWDPIAKGAAPQGVEARDTPLEAARGAHGLVLTTVDPALRELPWQGIRDAMRTPYLFDGRCILRGLELPPGFTYRPIGRRRA